jgi:hypothetical protein
VRSLRARLNVLEAKYPPPKDTRFGVWRPEDREAWQAVSGAEKGDLWALYQRMSASPTGQALVRRYHNGPGPSRPFQPRSAERSIALFTSDARSEMRP